MTAVKIKCPKCGWILGDTEHSIDCVLNCPKCNAVKVKMTVVSFSDYYKTILTKEIK
jgi:DNA-directed RNA polymerase subunit M/transcription elongation factor TFIIS